MLATANGGHNPSCAGGSMPSNDNCFIILHRGTSVHNNGMTSFGFNGGYNGQPESWFHIQDQIDWDTWGYYRIVLEDSNDLITMTIYTSDADRTAGTNA